jgi:hypothetical protein
MSDESCDAFKIRRAPCGKFYVRGDDEAICLPNGSLRYFETEHDAPTVSQGFDYQMPGKTDRCPSQKGLRIDGSFPLPVALQEARRSRPPGRWSVTLPITEGRRGRGCQILVGSHPRNLMRVPICNFTPIRSVVNAYAKRTRMPKLLPTIGREPALN